MSAGGPSSKRGAESGSSGRRATPSKAEDAKTIRLLVGWREWVGLPDLCDVALKAKIDTGARTSALHAWNIEPYERRGAPWIRFEVHPLQGEDKPSVRCEAAVAGERLVRSSSGHAERRLVIVTTLALGGEEWPIELSLTRRDEMGFRMLIGRSALHRRAVVDPSRSFLLRESARALPGAGKRKLGRS
jgi:ribosomal protein S6--L-glutamate ligase